MKKALLIIDVQRDFCSGGALAVPNGDQVVAPLNRAIKFALDNGWYLRASRDWHPVIHCSFKEQGGPWPSHCVQNTPGAKFHPNLHLTWALVISKGLFPEREEYSLFDGIYIRKNDWPLSAGAVLSDCHELYIGGLATDYCVKATALDAVKKGFKTYLLLDACRAVNVNNPNSPFRNTPLAKEIIEKLRIGNTEPSDEMIAIEEMRQAGVILTTTEKVINGK